MKLKLNYECFDKGLEKLSQEYKIFAPVVLEYKGTYSDTPSIRYKEVKKFEDMEFALKSHFSPKEVMLPINEILLYFTQDDYSEAKVEVEKVLMFMRACDINAVKRVDEIYLRNGEEDYYYKRRRNKVKFVLVGCRESFRNCFCVSMNSNKTEDYAMALNIRDNELYIDIKDEEFNILMEMVFLFELEEDVDEKFKQSDFLTINAPAIAFPYVRSYISNLTLQSGFSPIILPSVNFVKLAKKNK